MNTDNVKFILLTNIKRLESDGCETQVTKELKEAVDILDDKGVGLLSKRTAGIIEGMTSIYKTLLESECDKKTVKLAFKKAFQDNGLTSAQVRQYIEMKQVPDLMTIFD